MLATVTSMLGQYRDDGGGGSGIISIFYLAVMVLIIVGSWKMFTKAGQPGWAAIVPIYNVIVMLKIIGKPWWWLLLMLIPIVNIVINILVVIELAKVFGKGGGFAVGLFFLPYVFIPILGFGGAQYVGLGGEASPLPTPAPVPPAQGE